MRELLEVDEIMSILRTSVARLHGLAARATPDQLRPARFDESWTLTAVLAHLRACNDVLGGNLIRIVREDGPSWRRLSPREWQRRHLYNAEEFAPAMAAFDRGRGDLLAILEWLPVSAWDRTATVTVAPGKVVAQSMRFFGDWLASHESEHLQDVERAIHSSG